MRHGMCYNNRVWDAFRIVSAWTSAMIPLPYTLPVSISRRRCRSGLTLIEALAVIVVLGILVGALTTLARHASFAANTGRARAELGEFADALDRYALRFGKYPLDANVEVDATNLWSVVELLPGLHPGENEYHFSDLLPEGFTGIDPWKRPYRYQRLARPGDAEDEESYELFSFGPDAELPDDDIRLQP